MWPRFPGCQSSAAAQLARPSPAAATELRKCLAEVPILHGCCAAALPCSSAEVSRIPRWYEEGSQQTQPQKLRCLALPEASVCRRILA